MPVGGSSRNILEGQSEIQKRILTTVEHTARKESEGSVILGVGGTAGALLIYATSAFAYLKLYYYFFQIALK